MWTTPAPPSTAFVAASIWSGTGDVNTSPGQAASSIPWPTKPPCSGSCPEPPPETGPTLPGLGPPARSTTRFSRSIFTSSGCAAPSPARLSGTTSSTRLMSFLTRATVGVVMNASSGVGVGGFRDRDARNFRCPMVADVLVQEGAHQASHDRPDEVHRKLAEMLGELGVTDHALDEQRTDLARRVQRGAGDRTDQDDDPVHDEADDDPREARGCAPVDGRA